MLVKNIKQRPLREPYLEPETVIHTDGDAVLDWMFDQNMDGRDVSVQAYDGNLKGQKRSKALILKATKKGARHNFERNRATMFTNAFVHVTDLLTASQMRVLSRLMAHMEPGQNFVVISKAEIAKEMDVHPTAVGQAIKNLMEYEIITERKSRGIYDFNPVLLWASAGAKYGDWQKANGDVISEQLFKWKTIANAKATERKVRGSTARKQRGIKENKIIQIGKK